jgi:putative addiction module component (TIGR02574 family)
MLSMTAEDVLQAALALSPEERVQLIEQLEQSLPVRLEPEVAAMISERVARARAGEPGIPAADVFAEARRR